MSQIVIFIYYTKINYKNFHPTQLNFSIQNQNFNSTLFDVEKKN